LKGDGFYFNAGVILFDLEALRQTGVLDRALAILSNPDTPCEWADQDALNIVLWGNCKQLHPKWNFQRKFLYDKGAAWDRFVSDNRRPAIIHFTEGFKPWRRDEWHPCGWLYLRSLLKTPFRNRVLSAGEFGILDVMKSWLRWVIKRPPMFRLSA
jgi:lipopolysaccharide biosynthesis glycosyltransferase